MKDLTVYERFALRRATEALPQEIAEFRRAWPLRHHDPAEQLTPWHSEIRRTVLRDSVAMIRLYRRTIARIG